MYYSIQDNQTFSVLATGRNSLTKEKAITDVFDYFISGGDYDDDDLDILGSMSLIEKEEELKNNDFEIMEHIDKMDEDYEDYLM